MEKHCESAGSAVNAVSNLKEMAYVFWSFMG